MSGVLTHGEPVSSLRTNLSGRLAGLDRLRALAVVLMAVDHFLFVTGHQSARMSVTRAALPLFLLVAGALWRPGRWRRTAVIFGAGLVASVPGVLLGIGQPDVLILIALGLVLMPVAVRFPAVVGSVAILQPVTWSFGWPGYEPGLIVALLLLGYLIGREKLNTYGLRLPAWSTTLGKMPLTFYVVHLVVLLLVVGPAASEAKPARPAQTASHSHLLPLTIEGGIGR